MNKTVTLELPKVEVERLSGLALNFGLSLAELSQKIFKEVSLSFPKDSFSNYKNNKALRSSLKRALKDYHQGRASEKL